MKIELEENFVIVRVSLKQYNINILHKCFYWYTNDYIVDIEIQENKTGIIKLHSKMKKISNKNYRELSNKIKNDLIDFKTRHIITRETKTIRELLIAKAFSHSDEFDNTPPGSLKNE